MKKAIAELYEIFPYGVALAFFIFIGRWWTCYDFPYFSKIISGSEACDNSIDTYIMWVLYIGVIALFFHVLPSVIQEQKDSEVREGLDRQDRKQRDEEHLAKILKQSEKS